MASRFGTVYLACLSIGVFCIAALLPTIPPQAMAAADGASPTRSELVATEIEFLELVGGGPLTLDERQQAGEAVDIAMRDNPSVLLQNYAILKKVFRNTAQDSARIVVVDWNRAPDRFEREVYTQSVRQKLRYAIETTTPPPGLARAAAIENSIIRRHDPMVVLDRARRHIVSEINLRFLDDASAWYARTAGVPGPSAEFKEHLRIWFEKNYLDSSSGVAEALSDEPQNFLYLTDAFKDPQRNEAAMQALRTQLEGENPPTRDVSLAIAVSDASRTAHAQVRQALDKMNQTAVQAAHAIGYGSMVNQTQGALWHPH